MVGASVVGAEEPPGIVGVVDGAGVEMGVGVMHDNDNDCANSFTQYTLVVLEFVILFTFELFSEEDDIGDFMHRMFIVAACCESHRKR